MSRFDLKDGDDDIPHPLVLNESSVSTKLRVVFDGFSKSLMIRC